MKVKRIENDLDLEMMEGLLSLMDKDDLNKMKYAEDLANYHKINNNDLVQLGPIDRKTFQYIIFLILSDYEIFYPRK